MKKYDILRWFMIIGGYVEIALGIMFLFLIGTFLDIMGTSSIPDSHNSLAC